MQVFYVKADILKSPVVELCGVADRFHHRMGDNPPARRKLECDGGFHRRGQVVIQVFPVVRRVIPVILKLE